ncbi:MAG: hypothetical protein Q7T97_18540 [Burkholderiaceae bacterium]|nr:hypothetical protein [Burkholderiaceae bacterium]
MLTPSIVLVVLLIAFLLWTPDWDRAVLESRYRDAPSDLMEVADVRLHFRDSGPVAAPVRDPHPRLRRQPAHLGALGAELAARQNTIG